jgi:hypothetical protein
MVVLIAGRQRRWDRRTDGGVEIHRFGEQVADDTARVIGVAEDDGHAGPQLEVCVLAPNIMLACRRPQNERGRLSCQFPQEQERSAFRCMYAVYAVPSCQP